MIKAPEGYAPTSGPTFDGGTEADRDSVLDLYYKYWLANDAYNGAELGKIWDHNPDNIHFNTNGHSYQGYNDWLKIWAHYSQRQAFVEPLGLGNVRVIVREEMAVITADRILRSWTKIGETRPVLSAEVPYCRATFVFVKNEGAWTTVHVHFSMGRFGLRPDQGGKDDAHLEAHGLADVK